MPIANFDSRIIGPPCYSFARCEWLKLRVSEHLRQFWKFVWLFFCANCQFLIHVSLIRKSRPAANSKSRRAIRKTKAASEQAHGTRTIQTADQINTWVSWFRSELVAVLSQALASVGKLMRSLQALQVSNGVGFGHHYDNFVGQGEDMGEWEQYQ